MCGRIRQFSRDIHVGDRVNFITPNGIANGTFGVLPLKGEVMYNAKVESLTTVWKAYSERRGILIVDGFYEGDTYFTYGGDKKIAIAVIYNNMYDFLIVTRAAKPPVIQVHQRQPMIISDHDKWIKDHYFTSPKETLIKIA